MQRYALAEDGNEPGVKLHRFKAVAIDPSKGTATGYIAKYIAKNIDGFNLEKDLYGNAAAEAAERITTWANIWGIRQFQQIGGPSVTVLRQLRRLGETEDQKLETIRQTATASDWVAFVLVTGGPDMQRSEQAIKPFYDFSRQLNPNTGEIIFKTQDSYGSKATRQPAGVIWRKTPLDTRKHFWSVLNPDNDPLLTSCQH